MSHTRVRLSVPTEILRQDHRKIRELLEEYDAVPREDPDLRDEIFQQIHRLLLLHFLLEEEVLYPAVRRTGTERAVESVEEARWGHRLVRQLLAEMEPLGRGEARFESKMRLLRLNLEHYARAEERTLFAEVRSISREMQHRLLDQLEARREEWMRQERRD
jgi:hemerythrin superfamily protein